MKKKIGRSEYLKKKRLNAETTARLNQTKVDFTAYIKETKERNERERIERIEAEEYRIMKARQKAEDEMLSKMTSEEREQYHKNKKEFMRAQAERLGRMAGMGLL